MRRWWCYKSFRFARLHNTKQSMYYELIKNMKTIEALCPNMC